jgi:dTDP-glucose 4,6-dehydratase
MKSQNRNRLLLEDLESVVSLTGSIWQKIAGKRIFITGGTGFFGSWLLESIAHANEKLGLEAHVVVLTRNPKMFREKVPHLAADRLIELLPGNVIDFNFPKDSFDYVIHAATESSTRLNKENPLLMVDTIVSGTRRVLEFSQQKGVKKILYISSGAVYGNQPPDIPRLEEDFYGGPNVLNVASAYSEGKRMGELCCKIFSEKYDIGITVARCFAFVGPYLSLNAHYAIGNFIRDGLEGGTIVINGDGSPKRSYLYAADLTTWLWTLLINGENGEAYNVGSDRTVTIFELAKIVAKVFGSINVQVKNNTAKPSELRVYVPSVEKAKKKLGLLQTVELETAIQKTIEWNR